MFASVGIPEGGIVQPARARRVKIAKVAAIAGERISLAPERMAFPLSNRRWSASGCLTNLSAGRQPISF
jgi:hypothetical protein